MSKEKIPDYQTINLPLLTGNVQRKRLDQELVDPPITQSTLITQPGDIYKPAPMPSPMDKVVSIVEDGGYQGICTLGKSAGCGIFILQGNRMSAYHSPGGLNEETIERIANQMTEGFNNLKGPRYAWLDYGSEYRQSENYNLNENEFKTIKKAMHENLGVNSENIFISQGNVNGAMNFKGDFGRIFTLPPSPQRSEDCKVEENGDKSKHEFKRLCEQITEGNTGNIAFCEKVNQLKIAISDISDSQIKLEAYEITSKLLVNLSKGPDEKFDEQSKLMSDYVQKMDNLKPSLLKIAMIFSGVRNDIDKVVASLKTLVMPLKQAQHASQQVEMSPPPYSVADQLSQSGVFNNTNQQPGNASQEEDDKQDTYTPSNKT